MTSASAVWSEPPACRVVRAYGAFEVGAIIRPTAAFREELIRRGLVELVGEEASGGGVETATAPTPEPATTRRRRSTKKRAGRRAKKEGGA